jgi:hypothetical protein
MILFLPMHSKEDRSQAPAAHACNPSYSGGDTDQEYHGLKPAHTNSLWYPI